MSHARQALQRCIDRCVKAKDGRGRWRAQKDCADALAASGSEGIARDAAAAARRIGEWLAQYPAPQQAAAGGD